MHCRRDTDKCLKDSCRSISLHHMKRGKPICLSPEEVSRNFGGERWEQGIYKTQPITPSSRAFLAVQTIAALLCGLGPSTLILSLQILSFVQWRLAAGGVSSDKAIQPTRCSWEVTQAQHGGQQPSSLLLPPATVIWRHMSSGHEE